MSLLTIDNLSKEFEIRGRAGIRSVLKGVNLSVEEGEFVCILGPSGCGKTTLTSLIAGLIAPTHGEICFRGDTIRGPSPERGVVFQSYSLLPWLNVFENVYLAVSAVSKGKSDAEKRTRTNELIAMVGLSPAKAKRPGELSGGMRQRVAVARGFGMNPKLLLMDEPFSALDALTRVTLQEELARIWEQDRKTVIMVTNDLEEAILLADRICLLTRGPGSSIGREIRIPFPRPRTSQSLSREPEYRHVRLDIFDFFASQMERPVQMDLHASTHAVAA